MTIASEKLLTAEDLLRLYSEGTRGELIRGILCETMATGLTHAEVVMNLGGELRNFVKPRRLGRVAGSDFGVLLERAPDTVREPDVAYISVQNLPLDVRSPGYWEGIPDIVAEIASPSDSSRHLFDKARMWISFGVPLVWTIDPETRTIEIHRPHQPLLKLTDDDTLDGGQILPGFSCAVRDLFDL